MAKRKYTSATIGIGSNVGDRKKNLQEAVKQIGSYVGTIIKQSSIYETAAWGNTDQAPFYNMILKINTSLNPFELLDRLQLLEKQLGRVPTEKYGPRVIDLDILLYGMQSIKEKKLTVPHPEIANRMFILIPLMEIDPEFVHPLTKESLDIMFMNCTDTGEVVIL